MDAPLHILLVCSNTSGNENLLSVFGGLTDSTRLDTVATHKDAAAFISNQSVDCAIIDVSNVEDLSIRAISRLQTSRGERLPIVALVDNEVPATVKEVLSQGAHDYLLRSELSHREVIRTIRYALETQRGQELARRLRHADRLAAVGQLAAGVAHEINNPIAFVLANLTLTKEHLEGFTAYLDSVQAWAKANLDGPLEESFTTTCGQGVERENMEESLEMVNASLGGIEQVKRIVRDLGVFSRIGGDEISWVDINEVLNSACNMVANEIKHRATLVQDFHNLPPIPGDRGKLAQVFVNLLVNAAHAISEGGATQDQITIRTRHIGNSVVVEIQDTGAGIPENVQDRVFDPFVTTKRKGKGTGLGLSLCADIVQKHNGSIDFDSEQGKGTTFRLELPEDTGFTVVAPTPVPIETTEISDKRLSVLIIDDEEQLLAAYRRVLQRQHDVVLAESGTKALGILSEGREFDVIICDLMMPEMDGAEVFSAIKEGFPALEKRMVFCSGGAFTDGARNFASTVANIVLQKPLEPKLLHRIIHQVGSARDTAE